MVEENNIQSEFPLNSCYAMLNTALGASQTVTEDLTRIGGGIYSYTVYVPNAAKAAIVGCLINSTMAKGKMMVNSYSYDDDGEDKEGFRIHVEERIF